MVYLQNLLLCKMYLNTVYKIKGDQNISASTEYKWCDTRMAMLQQGSFRGQQISAAARFTLRLGRFLGPQRRETRTHSSPNYFSVYLLNQSAYIHIGD